MNVYDYVHMCFSVSVYDNVHMCVSVSVYDYVHMCVSVYDYVDLKGKVGRPERYLPSATLLSLGACILWTLRTYRHPLS